MQEKKKEEVLNKLKALYKEANQEEQERLHEIFKDITEDKYYKENMIYYFKQFLLERY